MSLLISASAIKLEFTTSFVDLRKIEKKRNGEERKTMEEECSKGEGRGLRAKSPRTEALFRGYSCRFVTLTT